ncbi:hypothetical protein QCA50_018037 [Cerrena zonata]|uniref:Uncharacterized protein n=1 Tax=Cerrena zonata TaxID=2478898 RepID=A0AAW0FNN4_9APHY
MEVGLGMWTLLCAVAFCTSCTNLVWGGASLRNVIHAEFLALDAPFDFLQQLLDLDFLSFNYPQSMQSIATEADLSPTAITNTRCTKPTEYRYPEQKHAHMISSFTEPEYANHAISLGMIVSVGSGGDKLCDCWESVSSCSALTREASCPLFEDFGLFQPFGSFDRLELE